MSLTQVTPDVLHNIQGNITQVGTLGNLTVSGNATVGNLSATLLTGTLTTASQTNITAVGTLGTLSVTGNISAANLNSTFGLWGTVRTPSQTNITAVGTLGSLSVTGNITAGNLSATNLTGTLATASQTNITAVGNLTSLSASGIISTVGVIFANSGAVSNSTTSGALRVIGGVGISGALNVGGAVAASSLSGSISSSMVTTALGYTPYNSTNPSGYITAAYVQTAGRNSQGTKTVQAISAGVPSNATGSDGDIIYQY